jgi:hypothetical protein
MVKQFEPIPYNHINDVIESHINRRWSNLYKAAPSLYAAAVNAQEFLKLYMTDGEDGLPSDVLEGVQDILTMLGNAIDKAEANND